MTSEDLVTLAAKLYKARKSMRSLYGNEYKEKIAWYIEMIKRIMVKEKKAELEAMLVAIEKDIPAETKVLFMAAAVEIIEPSF